MEKFTSCNRILKLSSFYQELAKKIVNLIQKESENNIFVALDCFPNEKLNPFHYKNGLEDVKVVIDLASSFLGTDRDYLERKIVQAEKSNFKTDFNLGEKIGLWKRINPDNCYDVIDWSQPFVIKNKFNSTKIWHPNWRQLGYPGFATRGAIIKFISKGSTYIQKFYAPLFDNASTFKMAYRLIFFCGDKNSLPEFIGGLWIGRPGFKIYLGPDSLVGLISPMSLKA